MGRLVNPFRFGLPAVTGALSYTNLGAESASMSGWTTTGTTAARAAAASYPSPRTGTYYFWFDSGGTAYQDYTCSAGEIAAIDAGSQWIELIHYFSGIAATGQPYNNDEGKVELRFLNGSAVQIGTLGPAAPFFGPTSVWANATYSGQVPVGTRTIRLYMHTTGYAGGAGKDFFVDDIAVNFIAQPASSEAWFVNLGAEQGTWGWTQGTNYVFPSNWGASYPPYEGSNYFLGDQTASVIATQTIDVDPSRYSAIDGGTQNINFSYRERMVTDTGQLLLRFLDSGSSVLGSLGPSVGTGPNSWTLRSYSGTIPANTRKLQLYYNAVRVSGFSNDYYVDAISVAYA